MVNNFLNLRNLLAFDTEDDFYYVSIIRRRKDNPHLTGNHRVIAHYYITSLQQLDELEEEMIGMCNGCNARAYINLNRRSFQRSYNEYNFKAAKQILGGHLPKVSATYHSVIGKFNSEPKETKVYVIDVDYEDIKPGEGPEISDYIDTLYPRGNKTLFVNPTINGFHIISKPFNVGDFKKKYPQVQIHKDGPTILYAP